MKVLIAVLIALLLALQYRLWFGKGSIQELNRLREQAIVSRAEVHRLTNRNQALAAEVADLKRGLEAIEERARADLGMISPGETFYQFVRERGAERRGTDDTETEIGSKIMSDQQQSEADDPLIRPEQDASGDNNDE